VTPAGPLILPFAGRLPRIDPTAFLAPGVVVIVDVEIGAYANLWFNVVVRGDDGPIHIGAGANIQDGTIVHVSLDGEEVVPTWIGDGVAIGHLALLHACRLADGAFVGMKACVMDRAVVESGAMVAAGAVLTPRKQVGAGELWSGTPARYVRPVKPEEATYMRWVQQHYLKRAEEYRALTGTKFRAHRPAIAGSRAE
jgi:carbonic anhydrase/acetyltransferase-like protein (isoleucine patch superfamily)